MKPESAVLVCYRLQEARDTLAERKMLRGAEPCLLLNALRNLLLLLATVASGQVLEAEIRLEQRSRSLYPIAGQMKLYAIALVCSDTSPDDSLVLYSIDCSTNAVRRSIGLGTRNFGRESGFYVERYERFYTRADPESINLIEIDARTDSVNRRFALPYDVAYSQCFAYDRTSDYLYVAANGTSRSVGILDCASDSFVSWIPDVGAGCIVWDSVVRKMYVNIALGGVNAFTVIDCDSLAVVDTVSRCPAGYFATSYPRRHRLYTCGEFGGLGLGVVNTLEDTAVAVLPVSLSPLNGQVICNEQEDKAYDAARTSGRLRDSLLVLDCAGDSILRKVGLDNSSRIEGICLASWSNRLYCLTSRGRLFAIDCATDSVVGVAEFPLTDGVGYVVAHPDNRRIYVTSYWDSCIYVFRDEPNGVTAAPALAPPPLTFAV